MVTGLLDDVLSPQPTNVGRGNDVLGRQGISVVGAPAAQTSIAIAMPIPPPMHSDATPNPPPCARNA